MMTTQRTVLIVCEDSDEDFEILTDAVRAAGPSVESRRVVAGETCLTLLRETDGHPVRPAVVPMDLNNPGLDGREALEEIREDSTLRHLPVIVFSTSANPKDLVSCSHAGANANHVKPFRYTEHVRVLLGIFAYWLDGAALPDPEGRTP